jgi:acyl-CoA synthetase (AMP-forming)/AMP-acid ligase II
MPAIVDIGYRLKTAGKIPSYSRPAFYEFSESLPLTAAGKVDFRALESMYE